MNKENFLELENEINSKICNITKEIESFNPKSHIDLKNFKKKFLGKKKGHITILLKKMKKFPIEKKKIIGKIINKIKKDVKNIYDKNKFLINDNNNEKFDVTIPGKEFDIGSVHPLSIIKNKIVEILFNIGFTYIDGNEIENDWHNFTALNIPILHPSREMQDTFFLNKKLDILLRTHTSSVQIRYMKKNSPPFRILSIGKVYRNETISSHSNFMFHQAEGFFLDKNVSFLDLKQTIYYIITSIFGKTEIRFRSSYFPFTEPSAEVDVLYKGKWLEIMGCGMINPIVLENVNINSKKYSGFAFGLGIERLSLAIYRIEDIRVFFKNDFRFLKQFSGEF